jgi:cephalosporin hydroxylase
MTSSNTWHESVPDSVEFGSGKKRNLEALSQQSRFRTSGLALMTDLGEYGFGYKNSWMGVPIIRLPEDLVLQQEVVWNEKPDLIIEIGVARGGGLIFNASLQEMCGITPNVLGVDNKFFDHTLDAIAENRFSQNINLVEGDSNNLEVVSKVEIFTSESSKTLLILDSDHSSKHVLGELRNYIPILPINSVIMVCDTLIDEYPEGTYANRTWSDGKGPLDAIAIFRKENNSVEPFMEIESRALILSEIRDGLLRKVSK